MADMRTLSTDTNDCGHLVGQIDPGSGPSAINVDLIENAVSSISQNGVNTAVVSVFVNVFPGSDCETLRLRRLFRPHMAVRCSFRLSVIHAREIPECASVRSL